jgi:hypothetical protein
MMSRLALSDEILMTVEKPARYIGNEVNSVIKDKNKIGVPMGAGAYKATTIDTDSSKVTNGTFFESNVCYFERNEHFLMGLPKIKKIRYQVVPTNQMLSALTQGQVHYCMPNAKPEIVNELNGLVNDGFSYAQVETLGYGYIGINAKEVPSIYARRALISTMDTNIFNTEYREIKQTKSYNKYVEEVLKEYSIEKCTTNIDFVIEADLEKDGKNEYIIAASSPLNDTKDSYIFLKSLK